VQIEGTDLLRTIEFGPKFVRSSSSGVLRAVAALRVHSTLWRGVSQIRRPLGMMHLSPGSGPRIEVARPRLVQLSCRLAR
jgi:hypothetical protein